MTKRNYLYIGLLIWLLIFGMAFVNWFFVNIDGMGFDSGLNRITNFIGWQAAATIVAITIWWFGRAFAKASSPRWLSRVPIIAFALLVLYIAGIIAYNSLFAPMPMDDNIPTPKPVTTLPQTN